MMASALHLDLNGKATGNCRVYNDAMEFDAVVVGSGPNGLAAAIEIAQAGHSVCVLEARETIGGGARSAELTLPGFVHDVCSAIHPLAIASPFFRSLPLSEHGLAWIQPPASLAHPFVDGTAAVLERSIERTGATLGPDAMAYAKCFSPLVRDAEKLVPEILAPVVHLPRYPLPLMRFGLKALQSAERFVQRRFKGTRAPALFSGIAAHSNMRLDASPTAAVGLLLGMLGHSGGWPIPKGGSQKISDALGSYLISLGGKIITDMHVKSLRELPSARAVLLDMTPQQLLKLAGDQFPPSFRWELQKYQYGAGVFKMDWALSSPIPWKARGCLQAGTIHLGGTVEEIIASEQAVARGQCPQQPFVLLAQQSRFDETRAPQGKHTAWAYCHVPRGSKIDMAERIESQVERFAPGFRDCIIERHSMTPTQFETYNPNYVGGDISGGLQNLLQIIVRPSLRLSPYTTPIKSLFICSSSTPPGGGVHGMCGYHAARAALSTIFAAG
jgi:phytoene dehydrogenase-like protein